MARSLLPGTANAGVVQLRPEDYVETINDDFTTPATAIAAPCPRCRRQSLVEVRDVVEVLRPFAHAGGRITRDDTTKEVIVRVCSDAKCGYRSDDT